MKIKQIMMIIAGLLVLNMTMGTVFAANTSIEFRGEAEKFVTSVDGNQEGFTNMEPGEERTITLNLTNADSTTMDFFMSADILENIAETTEDKQAVYDFSIDKNGESFFSTTIGGGNAYNNSIGKEYLSEDNNIKLDTLAQGQSDAITLHLKLDGQSTENSYMNKTGVIQLVFSASTPVINHPDDIIKTITNYVTGKGNTITNTVTGNTPNNGTRPNVNTGVQATFAIISIVIALVLVAVAIVVVRRKRK